MRPAEALLQLVLAIGVLYLIFKPIYNVFFHPLRHYPGPKLWAASRIPFQRVFMTGLIHRRILELHEKYGDVVRIAPNEISYLRPDAWKEIVGHRKGEAGENGKDPIFYNRKGNIITADREDHSRFRRILSQAFSAKSMMEQQPLITRYVDLFVRRLHENAEDGTRPLNMVAWLNYTTFDIIGDLCFGESFNSLESSNYHPWVSLIFQSVKQGTILSSLQHFIPNINTVVLFLFPSARAKMDDHTALIKQRVAKRLAMPDPRPDFMEQMQQNGGRTGMTNLELVSNTHILIVAGSETTATTLSGTVYFLGTNPRVLSALAEEVRGSFSSEDEIDLLSVQKLKYMLAVLNESMRMFPAVPVALPRVAPPGGAIICGKYVPEGTILDIWQWAMYKSPKNFALPNSFIPERWMGDDPQFANDQIDAFQPFSHGPRNCLGKNLAYAEMRLILARLIWNFDLRLDDDSRDWIGQNRVYLLWEKAPLNVYLKPRKI